MDLGLSEEQAALVDSFSSLLSKLSSPADVRAAEPSGFAPDLWASLVETGAVTMAVSEDVGGWGAGLVDLALIAEELGTSMASAPLIESQVALRLLAASGATAEVARALEAGDPITVALRPQRSGRFELVPAGAVSVAVVVLEDDELRLMRIASSQRQLVSNLADAPLADLDSAPSILLADGDRAAELYELALDEWLTLTAAAIVGCAVRANEIACEYARERRAFGAAIGSFQGVSHPLADDAVRIDGARLLARKAAWSLDTASPRRRELAAMAFEFAAAAAATATYNAVHVHGGYGFMLEYDVQLLYRRARGWPRVWGDAATANERVASARYGGA